MKSEDQTQFMEDQLLWQQEAAAPMMVSKPTAELPITEKKKPSIKTFVLVGAAVFGSLIILLMMLMGVGRNGLQLIPEPSPSPSPTLINQTEFDKAFKRLQNDIKNADATVNDIPFPPVNPTLYIVTQE
ncbi:MAG TPA: hypothetical protein VJ246_03445 [Patescibacteria group bacterium]|nr:hypothetical protein [Patescibacteria group bacterium]